MAKLKGHEQKVNDPMVSWDVQQLMKAWLRTERARYEVALCIGVPALTLWNLISSYAIFNEGGFPM